MVFVFCVTFLRQKGPEEGEDYIGYSFRKKNWKWRFYYHIRFELAVDTEDKKQHIWFSLSLVFKKTFREALRKKYLEESSEAVGNLGKEFDVTWDQDEISVYTKLFELLRGSKSREDQRKRIMDFIDATLVKIEKSGLVRLAEKASKEYKS